MDVLGYPDVAAVRARRSEATADLLLLLDVEVLLLVVELPQDMVVVEKAQLLGRVVTEEAQLLGVLVAEDVELPVLDVELQREAMQVVMIQREAVLVQVINCFNFRNFMKLYASVFLRF